MPTEHTEPSRPSLPRRRVFAEGVAVADLVRSAVLDPLAARGVQLVVGMQDGEGVDVAPVVAAARSAGVSVALWPMLANIHGRWASSANATRWSTHVRERIAELGERDRLPDELCIDLEPPIATVRELVSRRWSGLRPQGIGPATITELTRCIRELAERQIPTWAAAVPLVLADGDRGGFWQRVLGTPIDPLPLSGVCAMLYSSLVPGYARGLLRREHAETLVSAGALACVRRFGPRARVALGAVGIGALGDEATYADTDELARDVAITRRAGIDDIALFDLGGAIARGPLERWLAALCDTPPAPALPRPSRRVRALLASMAVPARVAERIGG